METFKIVLVGLFILVCLTLNVWALSSMVASGQSSPVEALLGLLVGFAFGTFAMLFFVYLKLSEIHTTIRKEVIGK